MALASVLNFSATTPAPPSGYLLATPQNDAGTPTCNQTFAVPLPSTEVVAFTGTAGALGHTPLAIIGLFKNGQKLTALGDAPDYSITGTAITLTVAATGGDFYEACYIHA